MSRIRRYRPCTVGQYLFIIVMPVIILFSCDSDPDSLPVAKNGVIDLRKHDFARSSVALQGEYRFFWRQFLPPSAANTGDSSRLSINMPVPGKWNGHIWNGFPLPGNGFATYHLTVLLPESHPALSLRVLDMATAGRIYVNGKLVSQSGNPARSSLENRPLYRPHVADISTSSDTLQLTIHAASYEHYKGGMWEHLLLGNRTEITNHQLWLSVFQASLIGSLVALGLFNLFIGLYKRLHPAALAFSMLCLIIAVRTACVDQRLLIQAFPDFPWWLLNKIEYLTFVGGEIFYALFFYSLFRQDFPKQILHLILYVSLGYGFIVALTPLRFYSTIVIYYQVFTFAGLFFVMVVLYRCFRLRRPLTGLATAATLPFAATVTMDIFAMQGIVHYPQIAPVGIFLFVLVNAYILAVRHLRASEEVKKQRHELEQANAGYRKELEEKLIAEAENQILQEKLARSQKMEALGLLAGGVAHDLNNVMTGIVSFPDLLLLDMKDNDPMYEPLHVIRSSGTRAAAIVEDLLALARRNVVSLRATDINSVIEDYMQSAEHQALSQRHPNVECRYQLELNIPGILGTTVQLRKAVMNLVSNAAEAQPGGGSIILSTESRYLETELNGYEMIPAGQYVVLAIEDQGTGLSDEDLRRMFEPFYTRKVMGRSGTGLGMAVIWGTVRDHRGYIDITTAEGKGTKIEIYLQPTEEVVEQEKGPVPIEQFSGSGEKVLIVDDLAEQRDIASSILQRLNYKPTVADSGEAAIEFLRSNRPDLVILDMIMDPGIDGLDTFREIQQMHDDLPVVIASGYAETDRVRKALRLGVGAYLRKPYLIEKLGTVIRQVLSKDKYTAVDGRF